MKTLQKISTVLVLILVFPAFGESERDLALRELEELIENAKDPQSSAKKPLEQKMIFVSFSMPDTALRAYFNEAQKEGFSLVLRGLPENSFKTLSARVKALKISVEINPKAFEEHNVEGVPTIIKTGAHGGRIEGMVPLQTAIELMGGEK